MNAGPAKTITGSVLNKSLARDEELSFVEEFRYLGHIMTADCRDDKDIKETIQEAKRSGQYAGQEILICTY